MLRVVEGHLESNRVSRVIYGTIIGLALVVALEDHHPDPGVMVATLLATAVAIALAELYSEILGTEVRTQHRVGRARLREIATDVGAVAFGISFPAVFFLLSVAGAMQGARPWSRCRAHRGVPGQHQGADPLIPRRKPRKPTRLEPGGRTASAVPGGWGIALRPGLGFVPPDSPGGRPRRRPHRSGIATGVTCVRASGAAEEKGRECREAPRRGGFRAQARRAVTSRSRGSEA